MGLGAGAGLSQFVTWRLVGWLKVLAQHVWSILALRHLPNCVVPVICPLFRELQGLSQGLVSLIEPLAVSLPLYHVLQIRLRLVLKDSVDLHKTQSKPSARTKLVLKWTIERDGCIPTNR